MIDDVNDNAPVLTTTTYTSSVMENLAAGQLVCKVSATDSDSALNKQVSFSLNYAEFAVNTSGFVYTTRSLDREHVSEYDIIIVATDHGIPSQVSPSTLNILKTECFLVMRYANILDIEGKTRTSVCQQSDFVPSSRFSYVRLNSSLFLRNIVLLCLVLLNFLIFLFVPVIFSCRKSEGRGR
jgi:hypothetical protein